MSKEQAQTLIAQFAQFGIKAGNHWGPNKTVAGVKIPVKEAQKAIDDMNNAVVSAVTQFVKDNTDLNDVEVSEALEGVETGEEAIVAFARLVTTGALNGVTK